LKILEKNKISYFSIFKDLDFEFKENNKIVINFKDIKLLELLNFDASRELQELIYQYYGFMATIEFRNLEKKFSLDDRKLDLKNKNIVKCLVEKYNAVIEKIEIF